jgi:excisionase family DNA binding protein
MRYPIEPFGVPPREAGEILRGSRSTIYRLLASGKLQAVKRGTATLVLMTSIRAYQASLPAATFRPPSSTNTDPST